MTDDLQTPRRLERARAKRPAPPRSSSRTGRLVQLGIAALAVILVVESLFGSRGLSAMLDTTFNGTVDFTGGLPAFAYNALAQALEVTRAENLRLRYEAKRLREDPAAIEEAARRDLGYAAPGEKLFILRDAKPAPTTPAPPGPK